MEEAVDLSSDRLLMNDDIVTRQRVGRPGALLAIWCRHLFFTALTQSGAHTDCSKKSGEEFFPEAKRPERET